MLRLLPLLLVATISVAEARAEEAVAGACPLQNGDSSLNDMIDEWERDAGFSRNSSISECTGNQLEMNSCAQFKYLVSESEMRLALKSLNTLLGSFSSAQSLLLSQGDWCGERDKNCRAIARNYEGGSAQGWFLDDCLVKQNRKRTNQLLDALARVRSRADAETLNAILNADP